MDQKISAAISVSKLRSKLTQRRVVVPIFYIALTFVASAVTTCVYVSYRRFTRPEGFPPSVSWFEEVTSLAPILFVLFLVGASAAWLINATLKNVSLLGRALGDDSRDRDQRTKNWTEILTVRSRLSRVEAAEADRLVVTEELGERVEALRARTRAILAAMAVALAAAAVIVLFAGRLTSLDATAVSNIDRLKTDVAESKRRLSKLYQIENVYRQYDAAAKAGAKDSLEKLDRQISNFRDDSQFPQDLSSATAVIDLEKDELAKISALLHSAWEKELNSEKGNSDWKYIVATAITRVGVVLVIVYLVQILMNFYRYNTRLITYYNSRRDLLMLWDGKQRDLKHLDLAFAPARIDFGKEPKHPLEDIIRAAGTKLATAVSREKKVAAAG